MRVREFLRAAEWSMIDAAVNEDNDNPSRSIKEILRSDDDMTEEESRILFDFCVRRTSDEFSLWAEMSYDPQAHSAVVKEKRSEIWRQVLHWYMLSKVMISAAHS